MPRSPSSIRTRLTWLVLASVVPAACMVFALITFQYTHDRRQLEVSTVGTARALAYTLDQHFAVLEAALSVLATSTLLRNGEMEQFYDRAEEVRAKQNMSNIVLFDARGRQLINTLIPFGGALPGAAGSAQLQKVFQTGQPQVLDLFIAPSIAKPRAAVAMPVRVEGELRYSLNAGVDPARLSELLTRQQLPAGWMAAIFDKSGTIAARNHEAERYVGSKGRPALLERIGQVQEDAMDGMTQEGTRVVTVFSRAPASGWTVVIGIPQDALMAGLLRSMAWLLAATLALLAASLALAWWLGRRISGSMRMLAEGASMLGRSQPVLIPQLDFSEADAVGRAMQHAAIELEEARDDVALKDARLRSVIEAAMDGILILDPQRKVIVANTEACRLFGYLHEELLALPMQDLLSPSHRDGLDHFFERLDAHAEEPASVRVEEVVPGLRRDGTEFPMDLSACVLMHGSHNHYVLTIRDATQRLRMEAALASR